MNTVEQIREFLEQFNDDELVVFAAIHPDDKKLLARSLDNKVAVVLSKPTVDLSAICAGRMGKTDKPNPRTATIFLAGE